MSELIENVIRKIVRDAGIYWDRESGMWYCNNPETSRRLKTGEPFNDDPAAKTE